MVGVTCRRCGRVSRTATSEGTVDMNDYPALRSCECTDAEQTWHDATGRPAGL